MEVTAPLVTIAVPVLRRPHRVLPLLLSIADATRGHDWRAVFAVSPSDEPTRKAVVDARTIDPEHVGIVYMPEDYEGRGDFARKTNRVADGTDTPWVFTAADDLLFHPGWLDAALAHAAPGIGVIGTNDMCNRRVMRGEHATHLLVARWYIDQHGTIDEPGRIFHEGYPHECCDDEAVQTAMARGAWAFARDSIVEHAHPTVGRGEWDDTYTGAAVGTTRQERMAAGRALLAQRRHLWSG